MPGKFTDKNGGNMAGHSDKWSDQNRRHNSHQAGQGSRGSRNQGTGTAGKDNTVASGGTDTSNMTKLDKLKYFNSLGLLSPAQKQELDAMENPPQQAQPKPEAKPIIASNPIKELSDKLGKIFAHKPQLLQGIVQELKGVEPSELKTKAQAILGAMQKNTSTEPTEVFSTIMKAIQPAQPQTQPEQPNGNAGSIMTPEEFHRDYDYLGKDFVDSLIKQASYFEDPEKALFHISLGTDNADINDDDAIRSSMGSAADDLGSFFELKGQDDIDFDDEEVLEPNPQVKQDEENREWEKNHLMPKPKREWYKSDADYQAAINQANAIGKNREAYIIAQTAMDDANNDWQSGYNPRGYESLNDMVNGYVESYWDDIEAALANDNSSTEPQQEKQYSPGVKHFIERNKEAIEQPTLEQGLEAFRKPGPEAAKDIHEFLMWLADQMKQNGYSKAQINKNINYYQNEFKDNWWKYKVASNAMTNNAEAYDPDEGTELEHWLLSLESGMEDYDRGNKEDEQNFVNIYNYVHGK